MTIPSTPAIAPQLVTLKNYCDKAITAIDELRKYLASKEASEETAWEDLVATFLEKSDQVHKTLWPKNRKGRGYKERGERLRSMLEVNEYEGQLDQVRRVRNAWVHFDEQIDDNEKPDVCTVFVDGNLGSASDIVVDGKPANTARHYDPTTDRISVYKMSVRISPVYEILSDIQVQVRQLSDSGTAL